MVLLNVIIQKQGENKVKQSLFEKMGGTYTKAGDYYIPNLIIGNEDEKDERPIGKYGSLRRTYLEEHRKPLFNHLVLSGTLHTHLKDVNEQAQELLDRFIPKMTHIYSTIIPLKN